MKSAERWNFKKREYRDTTIPDRAVMYSDDMDVIIQCANCEKELSFGTGYTSNQIHNFMGFGYIVCNDCYYKELAKERESNYAK